MKNELMREQCGTPAYIAPEILKGEGYSSFSPDIWSAGGKSRLINQKLFCMQCYMVMCLSKEIICQNCRLQS
jgi:serine/threonine protein kinase